MDDSENCSCPQTRPLPTSKRTSFDRSGCTIYGHPSEGGILIKKADLVDMLFLSLSRTHTSQRSSDAAEKDRFCSLMRRIGATWWASEEEWFYVQLGEREATETENKVLMFGWPADGPGVWVLRFNNVEEVPRDFGRVRLAMSMEERVQMMRVYGAVFFEDFKQVEELQ